MYNTVITDIVTATGNKFTFPGGVSAYNKYLEQQSVLISQALIAKLGFACKSFYIKYEKDFSGTMKNFTITLNLMTPTEFNISIEHNDLISNAFIQCKRELNPHVLLLDDIPYKSFALSYTSTPAEVDVAAISLRQQPNITMKRDYWGNLQEATYDYVISTPQAQNTAKVTKQPSVPINSTSMSTYLLRQQPTPTAPVVDHHAQLVSDIEKIININDENYAPFMKAVNQKNYARALRCACTSSDTKILDIVVVVLTYKDKLNIALNEQVGDAQKAVIHYAAEKSTKEVYDKLIEYGANPDLISKQGSARAIAEQRFAVSAQKKLFV